MAATCFIVGLVLFFLERREQSLEKYLWHAYASVFFISMLTLKRPASRIVQIMLWFMMLFIFSAAAAQINNILTL